MRIGSAAARVLRALVAAAVAVVVSGAAHAASLGPRSCAGVDYNAMLLDIIAELPKGGGYSIGADFVSPAVQAHNIGAGRWEMRVYDGHPSHCTSATYALFARLVAVLHNNGSITLSREEMRALEVHRRLPDGSQLVDGEGPYWIFNANGAGVAALFKHTGIGISFRDDALAYARPGDFLKLFWNDNVGASEKGHQVVYLGRRDVGGRDMICFWGSQRQGMKKRGRKEARYFPAKAGGTVVDGYGEACRPRSDIKDMVFSRITCMESLPAGLDAMQMRADARGTGPLGMPQPFVDDFLFSLRNKSSDQATLNRLYDIQPAPASLATLTQLPQSP